MFKEKFDRFKKFTKNHKSEIVMGVSTAVIAGITAYIGYRYGSSGVTKLTEIVKDKTKIARVLKQYCLGRIDFERLKLEEAIERLKEEAPINKYDKIPAIKAVLRELLLQRSIIENMCKDC